MLKLKIKPTIHFRQRYNQRVLKRNDFEWKGIKMKRHLIRNLDPKWIQRIQFLGKSLKSIPYTYNGKNYTICCSNGVLTTIVEGTNKGKLFWDRQEIRNKRLLKERGKRYETRIPRSIRSYEKTMG